MQCNNTSDDRLGVSQPSVAIALPTYVEIAEELNLEETEITLPIQE